MGRGGGRKRGKYFNNYAETVRTLFPYKLCSCCEVAYYSVPLLTVRQRGRITVYSENWYIEGKYDTIMLFQHTQHNQLAQETT
jgi:hypothetical protein